MPLRGLTIVVADTAPARLRTALTMALAHAALGGRARLFLDGAAVAALRAPIAAADDGAYTAAGLPTLAELVDEALAAGVAVILCQSGLALAGLAATDVDPRLAFGGVVATLADLGEDRLLIA